MERLVPRLHRSAPNATGQLTATFGKNPLTDALDRSITHDEIFCAFLSFMIVKGAVTLPEFFNVIRRQVLNEPLSQAVSQQCICKALVALLTLITPPY